MRTSLLALTRRLPATPAADPLPASLNPQQAIEGAAGREIGDAIAILMDRYSISYTKAFAAMTASADRTERSMPELATAVIKTNARQPVRGLANRRACSPDLTPNHR